MPSEEDSCLLIGYGLDLSTCGKVGALAAITAWNARDRKGTVYSRAEFVARYRGILMIMEGSMPFFRER